MCDECSCYKASVKYVGDMFLCINCRYLRNKKLAKKLLRQQARAYLLFKIFGIQTKCFQETFIDSL